MALPASEAFIDEGLLLVEFMGCRLLSFYFYGLFLYDIPMHSLKRVILLEILYRFGDRILHTGVGDINIFPYRPMDPYYFQTTENILGRIGANIFSMFAATMGGTLGMMLFRSLRAIFRKGSFVIVSLEPVVKFGTTTLFAYNAIRILYHIYDLLVFCYTHIENHFVRPPVIPATPLRRRDVAPELQRYVGDYVRTRTH